MTEAKDELLALVCSLEIRLHKRATRNNVQQVETLLHEEFEEIGRSGQRYDKAQTLADLAKEENDLDIEAADFQLVELSENTMLLTYKTVQRDDAGDMRKRTLRSSIWQKSPSSGCWQLRFHQGTPVGGK